MELSEYQKAEKAYEFIQTQIQIKPTIGIILGSGLGDFANELQDKISIPYEKIPFFKKTTSQTHAGNLVFGKVKNVVVVTMQGRLHLYEGYSVKDVIFPIRVMKLLGINNLIITNSSGAISKSIQGGQNDDRFGTRFPDMTNIYCEKMREHIKLKMIDLQIAVKEGIYASFLGPSFETPAEISMAKTLGADVVGMSSVPEAVISNHMGIKTACISCVCNMAAGISKTPLTAEEVYECAKSVQGKFKKLLQEIIPGI